MSKIDINNQSGEPIDYIREIRETEALCRELRKDGHVFHHYDSCNPECHKYGDQKHYDITVHVSVDDSS